MKKISIVVPVHNTIQFLKETIDSVLSQTLQDIELICVDDASDDGSYELLLEYAQKDSRIRVYHYEEPHSAAQARKEGVLAADAEYIMFLDADDFLSPDACEILYTEITAREVEILQFSSEIMNYGTEQFRVDNMYKFTAPYCGRLENEDVFLGCFRDEKYRFNLWNKIYSAKLCKNAMSYIKNGFYPKANDLYAYFIIAFLASSYEGIETPMLYHYRFGAGSTGGKILDKKRFNVYCHEAFVAKHIKEFLFEQEASEEYHKCADVLYNRLFSECIWMWRKYVPRCDSAHCFDDLVAFWGRQETVRIISEKMWDKTVELADSILGAECLRSAHHPIHTIGIFYHRMAKGGVQKVISLMMPIYHKMGYDIVLLTDEYDPENEYEVPDYVVRIILPSSLTATKETWRQRIDALEDALTRYHIDAFHYHASSNQRLLLDLLQIKTLGIPVIATSHEMFSQSMVRYGRAIITRSHILKLVDKLTVLSRTDELYWRTQGVNASYVPNPLEFFPQKSDISEREYILWIGRFDREQKQYMDAVEILKQAALMVPDIKMVMLGSEFTPNACNEIKEAIHENHLENNLELHDFTTDIASYYIKAKIQLITSCYEAFPMTIAEGKSFAVPQVIYDMPYLEMLKRCKGHIIVPQGDIQMAASEVVRLWNDPSLQKQLSEESTQSLQKFVDDDITVYWSVIMKELEDASKPSFEDINKDYKVILEMLLFHYSKGMDYNNGSIDIVRKQRDESIAEVKKLQKKLASLTNDPLHRHTAPSSNSFANNGDEYKVEYLANGGSGKMHPQVFVSGKAKYLTRNQFVRPGFTFVGWNDYRNSDGRWRYVNGDRVGWFEKGRQKEGFSLFLQPDSSKADFQARYANDVISLFAVWEPIPFIARFKGNGATDGVMNDSVFNKDYETPLSRCAFKKDEHRFIGWTASKNNGELICFTNDQHELLWRPADFSEAGYTQKLFKDTERIIGLSDEPGEVITFTAQWFSAFYQIEFDPGEGAGVMEPVTFSSDQVSVLPECQFQCPDKTFKGWAVYCKSDSTWRTTNGVRVRWMQQETMDEEYTISLFNDCHPIKLDVHPGHNAFVLIAQYE